MKQWQEDHRAALRRKNPVAASGTLEADAASYLALPSVKAQTGYANTQYRINWWVERLGHKRRSAITPDDIRAGLEALIESRLSPGTQKGYLDALARLWSKLDGRSHYCPVKDVDKPRQAQLPVRTIPPDDLRKILDALPQPYSKTSARILVFATTGFSSSMQQRLNPQDIDLERAMVTVPPRHKGRGVAGRVLPLTQAAVYAFKVWLSVGAQGAFNNDGLAVGFKAACQRAGVRPYRLYDLRHAFITEAVKALGPVGAMGLAMHSNIQTTMRYANGAVQPQMQATVDALNLAQQSGSWLKAQQIH
jgi:integrase